MLGPTLTFAMEVMERRHPDLVKRLTKMEAATLLVAVDDLPYDFRLTFGGTKPRLEVATEGDTPATATVKGKLAALLAMVEGNIDGDSLFFSRALFMSGDTTAVLTLRHALDNEDIDLKQDFLSPFGPFAQPLSKLLERVEHRFSSPKEGSL